MEKRSDLLFGRITVLAGYCTRENLEHCLGEQEEFRSSGEEINLGEIMLRKGFITFDQINEVLRTQHYTDLQNEDRRFGRLAVRNGFIEEADVRNCLVSQDRLFKEGKPVPRLGEMLVNDGKLTAQQMDAVLASQKRLAR